MATWDFVCIADAIVVVIGFTITTAYVQCVGGISEAIAPGRMWIIAPTFIDGTWTVALTANVKLSNTWVYIITNSIVVYICGA